MAEPPLFFFHNPKAAGSSIKSVLERQFAASARSPNIENDATEHAALAGSYSRFQGYDYYGGHFGRDVFDAVAEGHRPITGFRDPLSRVVSLYNFFRFAVTLPPAELASERFHAVRAAKTLPFDRFVASGDPRIEVYIDNQHFRQLTGSGWSLERRGSLADARRFIDRMPWYYVCEHPELSALWARQALGWRLPALPRENVTAGPPDEMVQVADLDLSVCRVLYAKNQFDLALYQYAVTGLVRRLTAAPVRRGRVGTEHSVATGAVPGAAP